MSERLTEGLDSDVLAFVAAERGQLDPVPADVRARLADGVRAKLAAGVGGGGQGGGPGSGGLARTARRWIRSRPLLALSLAAAVGAILGTLLHSPGEPPAPFPPPPAAQVVPAAPSPVAATSVSEPIAPEGPVAPTGAAPSSRAAPSSGGVADETEERRILDSARLALLHGDAQGAWDALKKHERRFPAGALAEEREALAVRTLVALQRGPEARAQAAELRARFPHSVYLPAVQAALTALGSESADD